MAMAKIGTVNQRMAALAVACCVTFSAVGPASARDDGVLEFFSSMFNGAGATSSQVAPSEGVVDQPRQRPLTIRPRRQPRLAVVDAPVKPGKVAILEDRTLRRGDAVMTANGLRIFVGSNASPHTRDDFVDLAKPGHEVSKTAGKVLADLDRRPVD